MNEKDSGELAAFGYKQELDRSLGAFSSFAAGCAGKSFPIIPLAQDFSPWENFLFP